MMFLSLETNRRIGEYFDDYPRLPTQQRYPQLLSKTVGYDAKFLEIDCFIIGFN